MKEAGGPRTTLMKMIDAAVQAGALAAAVKLYPESRQGLERAYLWHHHRCEVLVAEICHAARVAPHAAAGVLTTRK
jgi:hypothetical protein